jgi:hypothetical protein
MKYLEYLVFLSLLTLLFPTTIFARDKNEHNVNIPDALQVGSAQLKPGDYKVEWQGDGPAVQVKFLKDGKLVATVPGTLKINDREVTQDSVVFNDSDVHHKVLQEIDFAHQKEAILLGASEHRG